MPTQLFTLKSLTARYGKPYPGLKELYAAHLPMDQLSEKYRVSESNPKPTLVHFAIPANAAVLYRYAEKHDLTRHLPGTCYISPETALLAMDRLSQHVQYELELGWPFRPTMDCPLIVILYDNYTVEDKLLIDEDQEDVIQMVQEALELEESLRPKWYFDVHDDYKPGDAD